ncbi:MAG: preprotein translocase subunit SecG [Chloroflexota bacterium]|nr:preprotein translocase subunit SecG [Chloroflexota bacterium]
MTSFMYGAVIIVAVALILIILIQASGSGGLGGIFGGAESSGFRTRRGVESTLFKFTIILAVIFVVISAVAAMLG